MADFDIEKLQKQINELTAELNSRKKYGLIWDKESVEEDVVSRCKTDIPILVPNGGRHLVLGKTNNLLIEGDNYHSLLCLNTVLQETVDVIYIDPPYNTGSDDFVYNDKFIGPDDCFRHSKWLSFMEKRLKLARNLLAPTGMIMISINEIEAANLKLLCNEIFGEFNFLANMIWQSTPGSNTGIEIKTVTEYVLVYAKNKTLCQVNGKPIVDEEKYIFEDEWVERRGRYVLNKLDRRMTGQHYSEALNYPIKMPDGMQLWPGCTTSRQDHWNWRWSRAKVEWGLQNGFISIKKSKGSWVVYFKQYCKVDNNDSPIARLLPFQNLIQGEEGISSARGTQDMMSVLGGKVFDYPKPVNLIKYLLRMHPNRNATVFDFFAGSGTTGQAVLELNHEDGGKRRFILCTNNENNICVNVTLPRLKTVISGIRTDGTKYSDGLPCNLFYFETAFIKDEINTEQVKYNLVEKADGLLCIAENIFDEAERNEYSSHFMCGDAHLFIYNDFYNESKFSEFKARVCAAQGRKIVYVYSSDNTVDETLFDDPSITLKPIPSKIYEVYKEIVEDIKRGE